MALYLLQRPGQLIRMHGLLRHLQPVRDRLIILRPIRPHPIPLRLKPLSQVTQVSGHMGTQTGRQKDIGVPAY